MERAVDAGMPAAMLAEQFRMHPDICAAISSTFYGGKLRTGAGIAARRPATTACRLLDVSGREEQHAGAGFSNRQEAEALIEAAVAAARELEGLVSKEGSRRMVCNDPVRPEALLGGRPACAACACLQKQRAQQHIVTGYALPCPHNLRARPPTTCLPTCLAGRGAGGAHTQALHRVPLQPPA